jgi:hypothetical protein
MGWFFFRLRLCIKLSKSRLNILQSSLSSQAHSTTYRDPTRCVNCRGCLREGNCYLKLDSPGIRRLLLAVFHPWIPRIELQNFKKLNALKLDVLFVGVHDGILQEMLRGCFTYQLILYCFVERQRPPHAT